MVPTISNQFYILSNIRINIEKLLKTLRLKKNMNIIETF